LDEHLEVIDGLFAATGSVQRDGQATVRLGIGRVAFHGLERGFEGLWRYLRRRRPGNCRRHRFRIAPTGESP
jgi:hypothetical protein